MILVTISEMLRLSSQLSLWSSRNSAQTQSILQTATRRVLPTQNGMTWSIPKTKTRKHPTVSSQCWVGQSEAWNTFETRLLPLLSSISTLTVLMSPNKEEITSHLFTVFLDSSYFRLILSRTVCWPPWQNQISQYQFLHHLPLLHKSYLKILCVCMIIYFSYHCTWGPGTVPSKQKAFKQCLLNDLCKNYCLI